MTDDRKLSLLRYKQDQVNKTRQDVLNALIEINDKINQPDLMDKKTFELVNEDYKDIGISSKDLTFYLNNKNKHPFKKELRKIENDFDEGKIDKDTKNFRTNELKLSYRRYVLRTVQRALSDLIKMGVVKNNHGNYTITDEYLNKIMLSSSYLSKRLLTSILKLHHPLYNDLEKNVSELVHLFGLYVFLCLLEISRPINDKFFKDVKMHPMTTDEKNEFTENYLNKVIQTKLMYQRFLESFLNQPDNEFIKKIKKLRFIGKNISDGKYIYADENGKEYNSLIGVNSSQTKYIQENGKEYNPEDFESLKKLKRVPSSITPLLFSGSMSFSAEDKFYYELDDNTFSKVKNTFSKIYPDEFNQLVNILEWNVVHGLKNHQARNLFDLISSNKEKS